MQFKFEADVAGLQAVWEWMVNRLSNDVGLAVPLLSSQIDYRRDVLLTHSALKALTKSTYLISFESDDDGILFELTFSATGIIRVYQ